jgi:ubiquinone/menaquinone biosynthesis C-methylase UbiE
VNTPRDLYTHGHQDAVLRSHRWRNAENSASYLLPHLRTGQRLLDVGCGPGTLTVDLASRVAPGDTVGIDIAGPVITEAVAHAAKHQVTNVSFLVGDFRDGGLEPAMFDVVHAHQVLQHLREPVDALVAMARLARPGGIVAARDCDYSAFTWAPPNGHLDRWRQVYLAVARHNSAEPNAGRHLLRWARAAKLEDIAYGSSTWTFATMAERQWWSTLWAERCVSSSFARQAIDYGIATEDDLLALASGWRSWGDDPDAVFVVVHGEILGRAG